MWKKIAGLILVATVAAADAPATAPPPATPPTGKLRPLAIETLPNGLSVVFVPMSGMPSAAFFTLVRAGSRDEVEPGKSGFAHLFEHLMFRGTEKMPAAEYEKKMQALGSDNNAFTTDDFTFYVPMIPKESLEELIPLEAERFRHLSVSAAAYRDETGAVMGEFNKDFSNPSWLLDEALRDLAFKVHTYGHTTIGYKRDVEAMPGQYEYSKTFFSRFYTPDDCTIFVVGDVDRARVMSIVGKEYGDWKGTRAQPTIKPEPPQTAPREKALEWKGPTPPRLSIGYRIPQTPGAIDDAAALSVLATLAFGEPSALFQRLMVKEQKLLDLSSDPDDAIHKDPGLFRISAKLKPTTGFTEIVDAIQSALDEIASGKAAEPDVVAARNHLYSDILLSMQTPDQVAIRLAFMTAATGDPRSFEAFMEAVSKVTSADLARVAKANLTAARRNVVMLSPPKAAAPKKDAK